MTIRVRRVELIDISAMREMYRENMRCQIIHDSIHTRAGWTREYLITVDDTVAGYGSVAVLGPWTDKPTLYEFFVLEEHNLRVLDMFHELLSATGAVMAETQSNDPLLTTMLHIFAHTVEAEAILFEDTRRTALIVPGAAFRRKMVDDEAAIAAQSLDREAGWLVTMDGAVAATGDILYHYNRPYGDLYMAVAEPYRRRGIGSFSCRSSSASVTRAGASPRRAAIRQTSPVAPPSRGPASSPVASCCTERSPGGSGHQLSAAATDPAIG